MCVAASKVTNKVHLVAASYAPRAVRFSHAGTGTDLRIDSDRWPCSSGTHFSLARGAC